MSSEGVYLILAILGFLFLVVCVTLIVMAALKTLNAINQTCFSIQKQINGLEDEPRKVFDQVAKLSENLNHKMKCLDPLFHTVHDFGERVEGQAAKKREEDLIEYLNEKVHEKQKSSCTTDLVLELLDVVTRGLDLFNKYKMRR